MAWIESYIERLAANPICGYHPESHPATEPTAISAMALMAAERFEPAMAAAQWLAELQAHRGSVGISIDQGEPCWPTSMAMMVWHHIASYRPEAVAAEAIQHATDWLLSQSGSTQPQPSSVGHDSMIAGWPWVKGTHSWIEPTAWSVLAMKTVGLNEHERCRDGVRLLLDRQLPDGGCNYGNTFALGQKTLPHLQPTALALLALQHEASDPRLQRSLDYLERTSADATGLSSVCYAHLAQRAHGRQLHDSAVRIERELERAGDRAGAYYFALAVLALSDQPLLLHVEPQGRQGIKVLS